jgi:hypothetical protein
MHLLFHGGSDQASEAWPSILYATRWLTGTAWSAAQVIVTPTVSVGFWYPAMAISPDGERAHLVWEEQAFGGVGAIKHMSGTVSADGVAWSQLETVLSDGATESVWPSVAADSSGNVHVVWAGIGGGPLWPEQHVHYVRYDGAIDEWSPSARVDLEPVLVNPEVPFKVGPELASQEAGNQHTLCVAWCGYRAGEAAAEDVLVSCSRDGGTSWGAPLNVSRSPEAGETSVRQSIAIDEIGELHVAWQERSGADPQHRDYEIYYTRCVEPKKVFLPLVGSAWESPPDSFHVPPPTGKL